ncbi:MAG TPA: 2-amino-4-hydroxy-6-hydroxymethyldihydropteridine diphosphokinase, partial [Propionibacteriaceae bacterium]|nr:2-amino-4-hydroxy-6-hydroxymethyldihydropteridine diphosphokinase [Propionibacteriaceae bacterium]
RSPLYRTAPWGVTKQSEFLNLVLVADSDLDPHDLLALGHSLEDEAGRVRTVANGPRTLDVDLLAVGNRIMDEPGLALPHPRAHERGFVLVPWNDVDPDFVVPGHGRVADLAAAIDRAGVHEEEDR